MLRPTLLASALLSSVVLAAPEATRLPEVTTTASATTLLEQQPADETGRPDWTSARRFSTTRVYLQTAPGEVAFEQWLRFRDFKDGTKQARFYEEIEIGLPFRLQLDIYDKWIVDDHRRASQDEASFEIRFAPFNWGKCPLNPTIYVEWAQVNHGANALESKILLGEDITPRLHWGMNFVWERELSRDLSNEFQITQGISYTIIDQVLSAGVEMVYEAVNDRHDRNKWEQQFEIGPSVQVRPTKNTHLDLVALIGTNDVAPNLEAYVIFGIEFGRVGGSSDQPAFVPVAGRTH